jgi:hypothetical protein
MVVDVVDADHTCNNIIPSPSNVHNDFLDRKNGVHWDPGKPRWKPLDIATSTGYKLMRLLIMVLV